ncbi:MAG: IS1380 family transposase [Actinomycetota bacterium]|nr:IS1380 family transposase [Actinomycetota bacterium]
MRIGAPDESLTAASGVAALAEFFGRLDVVGVFDRGIGPIKHRDRGASAGQLLIGLAQAQLLGGDSLTALDRQRADAAASVLSGVPAIPSTTAVSLARRFTARHLAGVESATAELVGRAWALLPAERRAKLERAVTIDLDSTDVEVYGRDKQRVAYNYCGQRAGRPHLATWAEAGLTTAAELLAGNDDVRPRAAAMLVRALAAVPDQVRAGVPDGRLRMRADAGYFTADLAHAAVAEGCDFAIAAKRNTAMWPAYTAIGEDAWQPAAGMPGAQVAAVDYAPAGWPEHTYTIVRRVRVDAEAISADPRSRRRRSIEPGQLALALEGAATHAWAVSFIVTNIPTHDDSSDGTRQTVVDVEAWFRRRTDIEDRIREAKLGAGLRHLPSGDATVNTVWMWAALLAGNLSVLLQALTGLDEGGRAHAARLRHQLLCVPARLIHHARRLTLRLPPGPQLLPKVLARLRQLPTPA